MRVLFLGDIVGASGRQAVVAATPELRTELQLDFVIVNGENAAGGRGLTAKICDELFAAGVDVVTGGNHTFQHRDFYPYLETTANVLRPANYPPGAPGRGFVHLPGLTVLNLIGRTFMGSDYDDPFRCADDMLAAVPLENAVFLDFHAEATSEKQALGWYLDGRIAAMVGTHTHVATADARLLPKGTAYCTDAGMCGTRDSVIGDDVEAVVQRFVTQMPTRLPAADGPAMLNGVLFEIDSSTKLALGIRRHDVFPG